MARPINFRKYMEAANREDWEKKTGTSRGPRIVVRPATVQRVSLGKKGSFEIHRGRLHRALGISEGQKIPAKRIRAALKSKRTFEGQSVAEMARSARGLKAMRKGKRRKHRGDALL